ncbi:uncharacterized protein LOC144712031 [Wolffia australiana]
MAAELEVAAILLKLRRLIWEAASTHGLRWGARRRRSAGGGGDGEIRLPSKKRRRAAIESPPRMAATASPETPLDFCPSADEPEPKKKPRMKPAKILSCQIEALNGARLELEKEGAEVRTRLEALRERNSMLKALRSKLEREDRWPPAENSHEQEADSPAEKNSPAKTQIVQQILQQAWPGHWLNSHVVLHRGSQWSWMNSQNWPDLPDLNAVADKDPFEELSINHHHHHHQHQQLQRRGSPEEQRAARKKRIEMMHSRRRIAALR